MKQLIKDLVWAFTMAMFLRAAFGLALGSKYPFVAVMSPSMTHDDVAVSNFYTWMTQNGFTREELDGMPFPNGFDKGDALIIAGTSRLEVGDVVLYLKPEVGYPIIHRVVNFTEGGYLVKGDRNPAPDPWLVHPSWVRGKAVLRVPLFGWIRVFPTEAIYWFSDSYPTF
ncbi:MAG TPA: hypothetical protein ENN60_02080 [archaeon]|nr:hypothetical protein [archaeon]